MPLKAILHDLVEAVPGSLGAIFADWEGEAVEHVARMDDFQLKVMGAHHGIILENLRQAASRLGKGPVEEVVIRARDMTVLVTPVTVEYFVVLALESGALAARARPAIRLCCERLRAEIV